MQIIALATSSSENEKQVRSMVETYRSLLFPGATRETKQADSMEAAKKALAEEAKKVYMVRKLVQPEQIHKEMIKAHQAGNPDLAKAMALELHKKQISNLKLKKKMTKRFKDPSKNP
jgi:Fic family protein